MHTETPETEFQRKFGYNHPHPFRDEPSYVNKPADKIATMTEETVTISKAEYERLIKDSDKLGALEAAGVDNWSGYDDAMDILREEIRNFN